MGVRAHSRCAEMAQTSPRPLLEGDAGVGGLTVSGGCCSSPRDMNGPQALAAARGDAGNCPTASQARWDGLVLRGCGQYELSWTWDEGFGVEAKVLMSQDCPVPTCSSISWPLLKASLAGSSSGACRAVNNSGNTSPESSQCCGCQLHNVWDRG